MYGFMSNYLHKLCIVIEVCTIIFIIYVRTWGIQNDIKKSQSSEANLFCKIPFEFFSKQISQSITCAGIP